MLYSKKSPLLLNTSVWVTKLAYRGTPFSERGFVLRIHDDYADVFSIDSNSVIRSKRENIVTESRMREIESK